MKYIKETLKAMISQQLLANKDDPNDNIKEKKKEPNDHNNTQSSKHKEIRTEEKKTAVR